MLTRTISMARTDEGFDVGRTAGRKQDSVDFSTVAANDMVHLALIAAELGNASRASYWKTFGDNTTAAINTLLWDDKAQFYLERFDNGTFNPTLTPSGLLPLLLDIPKERTAALVAKLVDTSVFNVSAGLPTTSVSDPAYSNNMWRGGMWLPINYFSRKACQTWRALWPSKRWTQWAGGTKSWAQYSSFTTQKMLPPLQRQTGSTALAAAARPSTAGLLPLRTG